MPLARALADPRENRNSGVSLNGRADQFHDEHSLADAGASEHRGFATLHERRQEVDDLDARSKGLEGSNEAVDSRRRRMDGPALDVGRERWPAVGRLADRV